MECRGRAVAIGGADLTKPDISTLPLRAPDIGRSDGIAPRFVEGASGRGVRRGRGIRCAVDGKALARRAAYPRLVIRTLFRSGAIPRGQPRLGTQTVASRRTPYPLDRAAYRRRNVVERLFCRRKNWRRVATRYDRLARNYMAAIALAAIVCAWIK